MSKEDSRYIWITEAEDNQNYISMSRPRGYLSMCFPRPPYDPKKKECCHQIKNEDVVQFPVAVAVGDNPIAVSANSVIISGNKLLFIEPFLGIPGLAPILRASDATEIKDFKLDMDGKNLDIKIGKDGSVSINGKDIEEAASEE